MAIVTSTYRPKRTPRKKQAQALAGPTIVTTRAKPGRFGEAEDMTSEEHRRRGNAADELFRELVRRATDKS